MTAADTDAADVLTDDVRAHLIAEVDSWPPLTREQLDTIGVAIRPAVAATRRPVFTVPAPRTEANTA